MRGKGKKKKKGGQKNEKKLKTAAFGGAVGPGGQKALKNKQKSRGGGKGTGEKRHGKGGKEGGQGRGHLDEAERPGIRERGRVFKGRTGEPVAPDANKKTQGHCGALEGGEKGLQKNTSGRGKAKMPSWGQGGPKPKRQVVGIGLHSREKTNAGKRNRQTGREHWRQNSAKKIKKVHRKYKLRGHRLVAIPGEGGGIEKRGGIGKTTKKKKGGEVHTKMNSLTG